MSLTQTQLDKIATARRLAGISVADFMEEHSITDATKALAAMSGMESYYLDELLDTIDALLAATA
jgi:hypothetical protein